MDIKNINKINVPLPDSGGKGHPKTTEEKDDKSIFDVVNDSSKVKEKDIQRQTAKKPPQNAKTRNIALDA